MLTCHLDSEDASHDQTSDIDEGDALDADEVIRNGLICASRALFYQSISGRYFVEVEDSHDDYADNSVEDASD